MAIISFIAANIIAAATTAFAVAEGGLIGFIAAGVASVLTAGLFGGLAYGAYAIANAAAGSRKAMGRITASPTYSFGGLQTQANNTFCLPLAYGRLKLAGNRIWQVGHNTVKTIVCFADGEIEAISGLKINDIAIENLTGCSYTAYTGNGTQTIDTRVTGSTEAQRAAVVGGLKHTAYVAITAVASQKLSGNFMNVTAIIKGKKVRVYTNEDSYTTAYTNNPAWCILDFITCYNGCRLGYGSDGNFDNDLVKQYIDIQSFIDAADYCGEYINPVNATGTVSVTSGSATVTGSGTEFIKDLNVGDQVTINSEVKYVTAVASNTSMTVDANFSSDASAQTMVVKDQRFALNLILDERRSRIDWLNTILVCCQGYLVYQNGKLSLKIEQADDVQQDFDEDSILVGSEKFWTTPREQRYDIVRVQFVDPDNEYARVFASAEASTYQNEQPIIQEVEAYGVTSFKQASRLAWFYLNDSITCDKSISFQTSKIGLDRTVGDVIRATSTFLGYTDKKWRIVAMNEAQEGQIEIFCKEYNGPEYATLTTSLTGNNNDLTYTSVDQADEANDITITYFDPEAPSQSLSIDVTGSDIIVNLATDGDSNITTTSGDIITEIEGDVDASALVTVANATGNDGSGVVTATTILSLSGGNTGLYADTLGGVAPTTNHIFFANEPPSQRTVTYVVAANNSQNQQGADYIVPDDSTSAQDTINQAINDIPLNAIETGSVESVDVIDEVPTMTSNTAPSGVASTDSEYSADHAAWKAFDDNSSTNWGTAEGVTSAYIRYQFTTGKTIVKVNITGGTNQTRSPRNFTIKGSNNGTSWTTLHTVTGETWSSSETKTYTFSNTTSYTYYEINVTSVNGGSIINIKEIEYMEDIGTSWKAFNDTNSDADDCWLTASGTTAASIQYQFTSGKTITSYSITSRNDATQTISPKTWKLYGSNNGSDWTELDSQADITDWEQDETKVYVISNSTSYTYYKIDVTANNGHATLLGIGEIAFSDTASMLITFDSNSSTIDDYYNGLYLEFISGDCTGEAAKLITDYDGDTQTATVNTFSASPASGDNFEIQAYLGKVTLLEGTYIVDDSILVKSGVKIEGQGAGTVIKLVDSFDDDIDLMAGYDTTYGTRLIEFSKIKLDGNSSNNSSGTQNGINFNKIHHSKCNNIISNKFRDNGMYLYDCKYNDIISNYCSINTKGIYLYDNGSNYITRQNNISNNICISNSYGIYLYKADYNNINSNMCTGNISGIVLYYDTRNNTVTGNVCNNNTIGIGLSFASLNTVTGNTCSENTDYGIGLIGILVPIEIPNEGNNISQNICKNNGKGGIIIFLSNNNTIIGNTCSENGLETTNTYSNILVNYKSDYNNIQNNTCRSASSGNVPKYGIRIESADCDKNIVANNDVIGTDAYGTAAYSNSGTGTITVSANRTTS